MGLQFLGATGTVTGSRFLVQGRPGTVLVDCGQFQGGRRLRRRNWEPFPAEPSSIDSVVLTHAHLDHSGWLPALVRDGFAGEIRATPSTLALAAIVLRDAARLQEEEAAYINRKGYSRHTPALPLFTSEDAEAAIDRFRPLSVGPREQVASGIWAELRPAGHILGSASAVLTLGETEQRRLFFSGDVGRPSHPLLRPPAHPPAVDLLVVESTYGNRGHDDLAGAVERLARVITKTAAHGGTVLVPAFAVDRTEVLLMAIGDLVGEGRIPRLPVYVDSPMALSVLDVYRRAVARGDEELAVPRGRTADLFDPEGLVHELRTTAESMTLNDMHYPTVIVSASGMASGGRVLHHLARLLPDRRNTVVLAGFQAEGTRGRLLADGARSVKIFGAYVPVRARVEVIDGFSVHADADELIDWLRPTPAPETAFVVHGEQSASEALAERLIDELEWNAVVPADGERVRAD